MKKKMTALFLLAVMGALLLTGCVAVPTVDESTIDRPAVVVKLGDTQLEATAEEDPAAATQAPEETSDETADPVDLNLYNTVPAGAALTLTGEHADGIKSICYRFDEGQTTVVKQSSAEVTVPEDAKKLELYVIAGNEIASQWATYYLTVE